MGIKKIISIFVLLPTLGVTQVLSPATGRIDPIAPIVPKAVSKTVVNPIPKPAPIPQRLTQTEDGTFTITPANSLPDILPESTPIPKTSTHMDALRDALFGDTSTLSKSSIQKPDIPVVQAPIGARLKARIVETEDGQKTLQLRGSSSGSGLVLTQVASAPKIAQPTPQAQNTQKPAPPATTSVKKTPPPKPTPPKPLSKSLKLTYFADATTPENLEALNTLFSKLPSENPTHMLVIAQNPPAPLEALQTLPQQRWSWLNNTFKQQGYTLKGVKTSEILLTHTDAAFLQVDLTFPPQP